MVPKLDGDFLAGFSAPHRHVILQGRNSVFLIPAYDLLMICFWRVEKLIDQSRT